MCGFAGVIDRRINNLTATGIAREMGKALEHRGPDSERSVFHESYGLIWVHRRLAIQDLSEAGAQPMRSGSGCYEIVFNGEIYNFRSLRNQLEGKGLKFNGHSDTEVLLGAIETWGLEEATARLCGMFAFALIDFHENVLYLVRDRFGEKPLYYSLQAGKLWFGSELKALTPCTQFSRTLNRDALTLLLRHNFIPAPWTIYQDVYKLEPAMIGRFELGERVSEPRFMNYWQPEKFLTPEAVPASPEQAIAVLEQKLEEVVADQCIADVPLGAFLSGGVDSSTVAAILSRVNPGRVNTYSIGFRESGFDESVYAREVAAHLGTTHTELVVTADDALALVPELPHIYDEPFADSSQIPTTLLSRLTRQHVTVALSGDGGDELFSGYTRYATCVNRWKHRKGLSERVRQLAAHLPPGLLLSVLGCMNPAYRHLNPWDVMEKQRAMASGAEAPDIRRAYQAWVSYWQKPEELVPGGREPEYALTRVSQATQVDDFKQLTLADLYWYLPDDILVKVDRAAMSASLETRVPLLDPRIAEFALGLPSEWNRLDGNGKYILRQVLYRHVPRTLIDRPKQGFAIPKAEWLRGPLRSWADDLLDTDRLQSEGVWNVARIRHCWEVHKAGHYDYSFQLWSILMFQAWHAHVR